jgi:hypothetical protein
MRECGELRNQMCLKRLASSQLYHQQQYHHQVKLVADNAFELLILELRSVYFESIVQTQAEVECCI